MKNLHSAEMTAERWQRDREFIQISQLYEILAKGERDWSWVEEEENELVELCDNVWECLWLACRDSLPEWVFVNTSFVFMFEQWWVSVWHFVLIHPVETHGSLKSVEFILYGPWISELYLSLQPSGGSTSWQTDWNRPHRGGALYCLVWGKKKKNISASIF